MGIFRRKPIPRPLDPQLPPVEHKQELSLPYEICDYPRQLLAYLAQSAEIPEKARELIATLVLAYNAEVLGFLWMKYGFAAVLQADEISKEVAKAFYGTVNSEYKAYEADLLQKLEEDMNRDDN